MRTCLGSAAIIVALLFFAASPQPTAQTPATSDVTGVGNFSHVVRDMDRAVAFYRDVLGLEVGALSLIHI